MRGTFLLALAAVVLLGGIAAAADFRPKPAEATLRDAQRSYPRLAVQPDWYPAHTVGSRRYRVHGNSVTDVSGPDPSKHRHANVPDDYELRWMGAAEGVAFLTADRREGKADRDKPETNRQFWRLDLDSMKWLDPFKLPAPSIEPKGPQPVHFGGGAQEESRRCVAATDMLVTPKGVVLLGEESVVSRDAFFRDTVRYDAVGYHVGCFGPRSAEAKWTRSVRLSGRGRSGGGYRMGPWDDSIPRLTYVPDSSDGDMILVCMGEQDAVVCHWAANGKVHWRIPAIWEYERGFIGPSVFEHYIDRFGVDYMTVRAAGSPVIYGDQKNPDRKEVEERIRSKMQARRKMEAARKAFYARYQGRITAGPIVVSGGGEHGRPGIYVAAARSLKPEPGCVGQPEHALIYEIEPDGEIAAMTRVPRVVVGSPWRAVPDGAVLSCEQGCMVRLRSYEHVFGGIMGPGRAADDLVCQIDWYREYLMRCPDAWFRADPDMEAAGYSRWRLFRPSAAYIRKKEDRVYHLQINVVDLRTGADHDLTLSVPFEGELPLGNASVSSFNRGDATERLHSHGPLGIHVGRLSIDGTRLTVVLALGPKNTALTFDLAALLTDEGLPTTQ